MENPLPLGIYVTTITKEDNVRYDVAGTWELTLAEGNRYSFTQMGMPIAEGRYSLTQDQIVFTDEKDYAGECIDLGAETGTYKWAFDGEALTLTTVEDQCPCRNIVNTVHPWLKQE
jgi:hypothetical protein